MCAVFFENVYLMREVLYAHNWYSALYVDVIGGQFT
jgi:hypothetical protein